MFPTESQNWFKEAHRLLLFGGSRRTNDNAVNFLSNFYPCDFVLWDLTFHHVEGAFQARKFIEWNPVVAKRIALAKSPLAAKRMGRNNRLTMEQLEAWQKAESQEAMRLALEQKFAPGTDLARRLLDTGDAVLVEDNKDRNWGAIQGVGKNRLGVLLMQRREELRTTASAPSNATTSNSTPVPSSSSAPRIPSLPSIAAALGPTSAASRRYDPSGPTVRVRPYQRVAPLANARRDIQSVSTAKAIRLDRNPSATKPPAEDSQPSGQI